MKSINTDYTYSHQVQLYTCMCMIGVDQPKYLMNHGRMFSAESQLRKWNDLFIIYYSE